MVDTPRTVPSPQRSAAQTAGSAPGQPAGPVKARPLPAGAPAMPQAARQQAATATNQSRKDAARHTAAQESDEEFSEASDTWSGLVQYSFSWLTSMVFHMILLLVLALIGFSPEVKDELQELVINETEVEDIKDLEATDEELNEPLETDVETTSNETMEDVVAPVEFQIDAPPAPEFETGEADLTLAAAQIDIADFGMESIMTGDVLADVSGLSTSGLGGRSAGRRAAVRRSGGNASSEAAVEAALKWLADHQNRNGSWSWGYTPGDRCNGFDNPGDKKSKMGATGLALLPFLGAGYTHQEGKYKKVVKKGLRYLMGNMIVRNNMGKLFEENGAGHEHMYCHGIAACTLAEAYGMTRDRKLKAPAQLSINYIVAAQHPENGGWLYQPRQGGDTSVVGWQVMALKSAVLSYLEVPARVKTLSNRWLDIVQSDRPSSGHGIGATYGYRKPGDRPKASACSAIGLLCRMYLGAKKDDPGLQAGVRAISKKGPERNGMYYNYYASMLMYQADGPDGDMWKFWNLKMRDQLINAQVKAGKDKGSWHFPGGHSGKAGGRVYSTAMAAMTLEVYYRYMPVYQQGNVERDDFPLE